MNLHFNIHYNTVFGQELVLNVIDSTEDGKEHLSKYHMSSYDGHSWDLILRKGFKPGDRVDYFYTVLRGDIVERTEWRMITHRLELNEKNAVNYTVFDNWVDIPEDSYLYTSAFTECVSPTKIEPVQVHDFSRTVRL